MGLWGGIKKVGHEIGGVAEKAAPFVGMIPGVGTIAAAGIGGAGALLHGDGLKGALKYGAEGALGDIGANLLGKIPGVKGAVSKIPGIGSHIDLGGGPAGSGGGDPAVMSYQGAGAAGGGGGGGSAGGGSGYSAVNTEAGGKTPDWLSLVGKYAPLALGAAGAFQNAQNATQGRKLTDEQIQQAREAIARQKMLQDRALAPINVNAPDYSNIFSQTQNPFYKPQATQMESRS